MRWDEQCCTLQFLEQYCIQKHTPPFLAPIQHFSPTPWNIRIPFPDQPVADFLYHLLSYLVHPWDNFLINVYHFWITFLINSLLKKQSTFTLKSVNFLIKNVIIFYSKVDCKCVTISNQKMIIFCSKSINICLQR